MGTTNKKIFDLVESIGETLTGSMHIIDMSENVDNYDDGEREFRVYHNDGYCFDVKKGIESYTDEKETEVKEYYYSFYQEWEGFLKAEPLYILKELQFYKQGLRVK